MMQPAHDLELPVPSTSIQQAAEMYATAGFPVVPIYGIRGGACACGDPKCEPRSAGKHPIGKGWQKNASSDLDVVRDLFRGHTGNLGLVLGTKYVVLDVDGDEGVESLNSLGWMPMTLTSRSGSGGRHVIFKYARHQDPNQVTNRRVLPGLDIKTRNGQIVVAPSVHRSGEQYTWLVAVEPAVLPDEIYQAIKREAATVHTLRAPPKNARLYERATAYIEKIPGAISGSGGHAQTFQAARAIAAWVIRKGLPETDGKQLFADYNRRCEPPWSAAELAHKWKDALRAHDLPELEDRAASSPSGVQMTATVMPPALPPDDHWKSACVYENKRTGHVLRKHLANVVAILRLHPAWKGRVRFDAHSLATTVSGAPWHQVDGGPTDRGDATVWTDQDTARLSAWLIREPEICLEIGIADCDRAVEIAGRAHPYHPIRDYLSALVWDGTPRLATLASVYLGTPSSAYAAAVVRWWLASAVARVFEPGCKADAVLILEGPQGLRKSTALRVLAGQAWFTDAKIDITRKDAYLQMHGKWIMELAELSSVKRGDVDGLKAFFAASADTYVPPYGRRSVTVQRSSVFAGTVNPGESYLRDRTGNRRFWPIACTKIDIEGLAADRDQIWAEAVRWYQAGGRWWPESDAEHQLCTGEQEVREDYDEWENAIDTYLAKPGRDFVTVGEILVSMGLEPAKHAKSEQMRVSGYLRRSGWLKCQEGERRTRGWRRATSRG